jgi:hypothetical protein
MNLLMKGFGGKKGFKFPKGFRTVFKVFGGFLKMVFGTVKAVGSTIGRVLKPFMGFLRFGGRLFLGVFKKILWPIGIIFGLFAGVKAFMNSSESSFLGKMGDFMGGFMADFIGMPLQLLQSVVNWIMKKIFPGSVNADGTWDVTTGVGKFMKAFKEFDIKAWVHKIYKAPFKILEGVIWFVTNIFKDPKGTIKTMWHGLLRMFSINPTSKTPLLDLIFAVLDGAVALVKNMFGWNSEDDKPKTSLREVFAKGYTAIFDFLRMIFPTIQFGIKSDWERTQAGFKTAFILLGEWIRKIPSRLFALAKRTLGFTDADEYAAEMKQIGVQPEAIRARLAEIQSDMDRNVERLSRNYYKELYGDVGIGDHHPNSSGESGSSYQVINNYNKSSLNMVPALAIDTFDSTDTFGAAHNLPNMSWTWQPAAGSFHSRANDG